MAIHESLSPGERTGSASDHKGQWIPVAGRTGANYPWTVTVDIGDVESGGSVTARMEGALRKSDDDTITLHTFDAKTAPEQLSQAVTLSGYLGRGFVRTVVNLTGTATTADQLEAQFFNVTAESGRIREQVQKWSEVAEAAKEAERELLSPFRSPHGYDLRMDAFGFFDAIRTAVARQIEHRFRLWSMSRSNDPTTGVTLRQMDPVDTVAKKELSHFSVHRGGW